MADFYKLVLEFFLPAYIQLFQPEKAIRGRYISFTKAEYLQLMKNADNKKFDRYLRYMQPYRFGFNKKLNQNYFLSSKKTRISGIFRLSMLGNEVQHISNLYLKEVKTRAIYEKEGHVFVCQGKKIFKLLSTRRMKWNNNYSILSDFSHELIFKQKDLDKLGESLKNQQTEQASKQVPTIQKNSLAKKMVRSYKMMINALLTKQNIKLDHQDALSHLDKLVVLNNLKLPNEIIRNCKNLLAKDGIDDNLLQLVKEEELLILLSSLLKQEKVYDKKSKIEIIREAMKEDKKISASIDPRTVGNYLDKISRLDTSKYSYITE